MLTQRDESWHARCDRSGNNQPKLMKTFRFLLPVLALGTFAFAGETTDATTSKSSTLAERTVKAAPVRVELPSFDRAIRALVDSAAREALEENLVSVEAPALQAPEVLESNSAATTGAAGTASHTPTAAHPAAPAKSAPARAPLHVAGL